MSKKMSMASQILSAVNEIMSDYEGTDTTPPFFTVDSTNPKRTKVAKKKEGEIGKDLKRGVNDTLLGDLTDDQIQGNGGKDIQTVEFRDSRHFEEAVRILADDFEIGHPTYERGVDAKSLIFHLWKASDDMKERIEKAIERLIDYGLVQDTKQYPHFRKNK